MCSRLWSPPSSASGPFREFFRQLLTRDGPPSAIDYSHPYEGGEEEARNMFYRLFFESFINIFFSLHYHYIPF